MFSHRPLLVTKLNTPPSPLSFPGNQFWTVLYFISESSTEWPPTIGIPALLATEAPPFKISASISFESSLVGNPTKM